MPDKIEDVVNEAAEPETVIQFTADQLKSIIAEAVKAATPAPADVKPKVIPEGDEKGGMITDVHDRSEDDPTGGYKSVAHFAVDLVDYSQSRPVSDNFKKWIAPAKRKAAGDGMTVTVDSEGGVLVPPQFATALMTPAIEDQDLVQRTLHIPMATDKIGLKYYEDFDRSGGYIFGGVKTYWVDEEEQATSSKAKFGTAELNLHTLVGLVYATDKLIKYSPVSLEPMFRTVFPEAIKWELQGAIMGGAGTGRPLGILSAPSLVTVAKEDGQVASTIVYQNLVKMYARIPARLKRNMIWIANDDAFVQLSQISLSVGTGGAPAWMPANGLSGLPYDTLFGKPLIFSEHCPAVGTKGDIMAAAMSEYALGMPSGAETFATSMHLKFDYLQQAFRFTMDVDGQPWWPSAYTPKNGNARSPFVTLAAR